MKQSTLKTIPKIVSAVLAIFMVSACATYQPQSNTVQASIKGEPAIHTFYIAGGQGNGIVNSNLQSLLQSHLDKAAKESTLLFTGDYTVALENDKNKKESMLVSQLAITKGFKGKTYFIPGDNEWSSFDSGKIEWVEDYIKDKDIKRTEVEPNNVCPIEYREITEDLDMILVDSQWYIANWDRVEQINQKCTDIVTRRRFTEELEGMIKDSRNKNLVIVMHHPIYSNGTYAKSIGGFSPKEANFKRYNELRVIVSSLAAELDRVTIISGHEESLQYLKGGNTHQIISGSMGGAKATNRGKDDITTIGGILKYEGQFTYGKEGFAVLKYYKDGSSTVDFINSEAEKHSFDVTTKFPEDIKEFDAPSITSSTKTVAITTDEGKLNKSGFYKFIWGKRYRSYFGTPVTAEVGELDNINNGLKVQKIGGGHQSFSARLGDKDGREYAMRGLEKNALKFLRFKIKGIAYNEEEYKGSFAEEAVYDFFSTTHPFMQLVINPLAKSARVNHANTQLYYLPKQPGFEILGDAYGDQLYFIEERPNDAQATYEGYNRANPDVAGTIEQFESTTDVFEKIKEDEKYSIDQRAFIRARIFDMLIGDWDRHEDQWRWAEYKVSKDDVRFIPIPRDRDAAFSKFDGIAIPLIKLILPDVRFWQSYGPDIKDVKWFNGEGNNLDRALLNKFDASVWEEEAKGIQQGMTDAIIDEAFKRLPKEVQDESSDKIKSNLKERLKNIARIARIYGERMDATVAIHGTLKDDNIIVTRMANGMTKVVLERKLKDEKNKVFYERTFNAEQTNEIWIYGLDDNDNFTVEGDNSSNEIKVRLIGGFGEDDFNITNAKNLKVYEWKYEETDFEAKKPATQYTNQYETNTWHWRFFKENNNILIPSVGFRTDDGLFIGADDTYTNYGFNGNPFRYQHKLSAKYFFDFQAVQLQYNGTFANIFPGLNLEVDGYATNNGFAKNFFGYGNETMYNPDTTELEFNRARTQELSGKVGIAGKFLKIRGTFESLEIELDTDRFFTSSNVNAQTFERQNYVGGEALAEYKNQDAADFPTKALYLGATIGYKSNLELDNNTFGYASARIGLQQKLISSGNLVFSTLAEGKFNTGNQGDDFFFYHAPSLGGNNGLRGYRDERFTGKSYFYQSSDLKLRLARIVTGVVPITLGTYGGFDYGRVWVENDNSSEWHTSYGGGIWFSGLNSFALNAGYFVSEEDAIIQIGFGFGF
jgi:hypothetical protein